MNSGNGLQRQSSLRVGELRKRRLARSVGLTGGVVDTQPSLPLPARHPPTPNEGKGVNVIYLITYELNTCAASDPPPF